MNFRKEKNSSCNKIVAINVLKNPDIVLQIAEFLSDYELLIFRLV